MNEKKNTKSLTYFYRIIAVIVFVWIVIVCCSAAWNVYNERAQTFALVKKEALANFNKDQSFRLWGTKHGGVYVPPTEQTKPNPYLRHIPERDLTLPSGKRLTLMNPAYMVRQLMDDFDELYGIRGRITSLDPLNPDNEPDAWERVALKGFEEGANEFFEVTEDNGELSLRLMRPMIVAPGCLKCHAHQGYMEGDIRGGVGVKVSMAPYLILEKKAIQAMILSHCVILLFGLASIGFVFYGGKAFFIKQMQSENAIKVNEKKYRTLINSIQTAVLVHDSDSRILISNPLAEELFGHPEEQLVGKEAIDSDWHFIREDGTTMPVEEYPVSLVLKQHQPLRNYIVGFYGAGKDGLIWVLVQANPVFDDYGELNQVIVTFIDITERKEVEEKLNLMKVSVNTIEDCIFWIDKDAQFNFVNDTACRILGYSRDELLTMGVFDVDPSFPAEKWQEHWQDIMEKGCLIVETVHRSKDGKEFPVEVTTNRIVFKDKHYNCAVVRNIANRKEAENKLHKLNAELEQRVGLRTSELESKNKELAEVNKIFVGRELRMAELKKKIAELENNV